METLSYNTIFKEEKAELIVERSRFIAYVKPVESEAEAEAFINTIKKKHWDARHNVSAFSLKNGENRCSDDGEPSGTAGMPVLNILLKENITDAVIVVTRYFGGILLGTGGLVRAYSAVAKDALHSAEKVTMKNCAVMKSTVPYNMYDKMQRFLNEQNCVLESSDFGEEIRLSYYIEKAKAEQFLKELNNFSSSNITAKLTSEEYKMFK